MKVTKNEYSIFARKLLADGEWKSNVMLKVKDGIIESISESEDTGADYVAEYLSCGIIDNHIHGGDGFGIVNISEDGLEKWLEDLAQNGVCAVVLAPYGSGEVLKKCLTVIKNVMTKQSNGDCGGAKLLGVHFEGPFLSQDRPGAMPPEALLSPSVAAYKSFAEGFEDIVCEISLAPEKEGAKELIEYFAANNVKVLAGHTDATYTEAKEAFAQGVGGMCHTFNACRPIHHREPGVVTAALTTPEVYCEIIGDLEHLNPGTIHLIAHCKDRSRVMLISDAVATTNCPDGIYESVGVIIEVKNGVSRVKDEGCLDGGGCYTSKSVKKLAGIGIPFIDAVMAATENPARWLGLNVLPKEGNRVFLEAWGENLLPTHTFIDTDIYECEIKE